MSDSDIVARLRDAYLNMGTGSRNDLKAAADEIERLRTECLKWEKLAKERNPYSWGNLVRRRYGIEDMYDR